MRAILSTPITQYLEAAKRGEPGSQDALLAVVYDSLRKIAANRLGSSNRNGSLEPTELVHEAWIRLGGNDVVDWENRFHFFAAAAEAMRRTLIDNARKQKAEKRGGSGCKQVDMMDHEAATCNLADELLDLNDALTAFEEVDSLKAQVVKLKFFAGMTIAEIGELTNLSSASVERYWAYAKAWFAEYLQESKN